MVINEVIGHVFVVIGIIFIGIGIFGLYAYKNFYLRLLIASKIDTVGILSILIGLAIINGWSFFSAKLILFAIVGLILSPLLAHVMARSAYLGDHEDANPSDISRPIDAPTE